MTTAVPRRKADELIGAINEMVVGVIDEDAIQDILNATEQLKSNGSYLDAYNVKGMVAALRMDSTEMDKQFAAAIKCGGRDLWTLSNYAAALGNVGRCAESVKVIDEVIENAQDDLSLLNLGIKLHIDAFDVIGAKALIDRLSELGSKPHCSEGDMSMYNMGDVERLMSAYKVTWGDLSARTQIASNLLNELGYRYKVARELTEEGVLIREFMIDADVKNIANAERAINRAIADQEYSPVDEFLYFSCSKL